MNVQIALLIQQGKEALAAKKAAEQAAWEKEQAQLWLEWDARDAAVRAFLPELLRPYMKPTVNSHDPISYSPSKSLSADEHCIVTIPGLPPIRVKIITLPNDQGEHEIRYSLPSVEESYTDDFGKPYYSFRYNNGDSSKDLALCLAKAAALAEEHQARLEKWQADQEAKKVRYEEIPDEQPNFDTQFMTNLRMLIRDEVFTEIASRAG